MPTGGHADGRALQAWAVTLPSPLTLYMRAALEPVFLQQMMLWWFSKSYSRGNTEPISAHAQLPEAQPEP